MSDSVTRHAPACEAWREALIAVADAIGDIVGGITLLALPLAVMAPGLVAAVGLSIPLLVPFVVLALAFGVVSAPFVALWWLVGAIRRPSR